MNELVPERSKPSPSQVGFETGAPWKSFGDSINAISFGFLATAVLISMFLIMAIFEHLFFRNNIPSFPPPADPVPEISLEDGISRKITNWHQVAISYASDLSVVMPGRDFPTYIARQTPLPCQREGVRWPSHEQ